MTQTAGMIALLPRVADATRLAVAHEHADPPEELHLTLVYLGDDVQADLDASQRAAAVEDARGAAARFPPVRAEVMGHAVFNPTGAHDRKPCAVYLVTGERLPELHDTVGGHDRSEHSIWLPHTNAGFGVPPEDLTYVGPVIFDRIRVALAGEVTDIPLTGPDTDPPSGPDPDDAEVKRVPEHMTCKYCTAEATKGVRWAEGRAYIPVCDTHIDKARHVIEVDNHDEVDTVSDLDDMRAAMGNRAKAAHVDVETKRRVASDAGERRYRLPIGTELGQARNRAAQQAQDNPRARDQYDTLVGADPREYRALLDDLSAADLKALAAVTYSFRSSDPKVVAARIAVAGALRRQGLDVDDYGGLGKSPTRRRAATPRSRRPAAGAGSSTDRRWRERAARDGGRIRLGTTTEAEWAELRAAGWKGRSGDGEEALYPPPGKGLEDAVDVETKRTTTKPGAATARAKESGHTLDRSEDDGDKYPVRTIGDVAAAVRRADKITDEERRAKVRAHIRKEAARLKVLNMIPASWSGGGKDDAKGKGKGKGGFVPFKKGENTKVVPCGGPLTTADLELLTEIESKVMSPHPGAVKLRSYWAHGAGRAKWAPGTPGDFKRLRNQLRKYVPARMLNGLTANIHKLATGQWPGRGRGHGKTGEPGGLEGKATAVLTAADLAAADRLDADTDPDSVELALNRYADMDDEVTSEEAYEQALADEVVWDLEPDGTVVERDPADDDLDGPGKPPTAPDVEPVDEPDRSAEVGLAALDALFADTGEDDEPV